MQFNNSVSNKECIVITETVAEVFSLINVHVANRYKLMVYFKQM